MRLGIVVIAACALAGCTDDHAATTPSGMPPPDRVVGPLDRQALQAGNLGARCDGADLAARVDAVVSRMTHPAGTELARILIEPGGGAGARLAPGEEMDRAP